MTARILRGDAAAAALEIEDRGQLAYLRGLGVTPGLAIIQAGDDPASHSYVTRKIAIGERYGIRVVHDRFPAACTREELFAAIRRRNDDPLTHGVIVQLPVPDPIRGCEEEIAALISPGKDVDCFHPSNLGLLFRGAPRFIPCTPAGIIYLLKHYGIPTQGKIVAIVGRSLIVGRPLALLLARKGDGDATVIKCHSRTPDLPALLRLADIVVAAVGVPGVVTGAMLKPGATVVDVGVNRVADPGAPRGYRLVGDADFASVSAVAGAVTPVPGGVGPLTVAMLMHNVIRAAAGGRV